MFEAGNLFTFGIISPSSWNSIWLVGAGNDHRFSSFRLCQRYHPPRFSLFTGEAIGDFGYSGGQRIGIASPLCMYGTIPIAASFSRSGMQDDWLAAFMMSSILLNPQLIVYSAALGGTVLAVRIVSCCCVQNGRTVDPLFL